MFALAQCSKETRRGLGALLLALLAVPAAAQQRKPSGAEVWGTNCTRCHRARAVDAYNASQWESVVSHMTLTARLTPDETRAVRDFLVGTALAREAALSGAAFARAGTDGGGVRQQSCDHEVGKATFETQCAACHGSRGRGDGPAASALNPRPANLTDVTRMARLSEDSLVQIVTTGRKAMPGYVNLLTSRQVCEVVAHVLSLKP
ncbi:MAG: c-type cytochrome [Gemmatimonadetes bacterium]|nr:c-type cytochrome [Gemmatimonadota bacterium]